MSEDVLAKNHNSRRQKERGLSLTGEDVFRVSIVGAYKKPTQTYPSLLYAVTSHRPKARIRNVIQMACTILNQSKVVFFEKILWMLRWFAVEHFELLYTGKSLEDNKSGG